MERARLGCHDHLIFGWGRIFSRGSQLTAHLCDKHKKPYARIDLEYLSDVEASDAVIKFAKDFEIKYKVPIKDLNIAGTRESKAPGIAAKVERVMVRVFTYDWPPADPAVPPESPS